MDNLPRNHFKAILADPPWRFRTYNKSNCVTSTVRRKDDETYASIHYRNMAIEDITALPVSGLVAKDACLFLWISWPLLLDALEVIRAWNFEYKTCAFSWIKAHPGQMEMFRDDFSVQVGNGYWTRANSEMCLLATRGSPKRLNADVRQAIIEPRREHSRKPDCIYERIERLVEGPYLELFARTTRKGWTSWGNETDKFVEVRQDALSL